MPETEHPKSRLPNGKINPAYTAWRKAQKVAESPVAVIESPAPPTRDELDKAIQDTLKAAHKDITKAAVEGRSWIKMPETMTLKCIKAAKNPKFVFCDLGGVKVPVRCKRGLSKKMPGKRIKVSVDNSGTTPIYTHIR